MLNALTGLPHAFVHVLAQTFTLLQQLVDAIGQGPVFGRTRGHDRLDRIGAKKHVHAVDHVHQGLHIVAPQLLRQRRSDRHEAQPKQDQQRPTADHHPTPPFRPDLPLGLAQGRCQQARGQAHEQQDRQPQSGSSQHGARLNPGFHAWDSSIALTWVTKSLVENGLVM